MTAQDRPPILFVHGNGDSAALWQTTIWRFESNGWPRERLFAFDQPYPLARDDDRVAQNGRSSTAESLGFLQEQVSRVLAQTGAPTLVLVGNSRGGNTIRNFMKNGGGDRVVQAVVLGGTPAHGIWAVPGLREGNEFSARSAFLQGLNQPRDAAGDEVETGARWLTLRSDRNDKYAQPDGRWIGAPGVATQIGYDAPALKGATNLVLPGVDHRETSFSPESFEATWRFLTGTAPTRLQVEPESDVRLSGRLTGLGPDAAGTRPNPGDAPNNLGLAGAQLTIHEVDPATGERRGAPLHRQTIATDGRWGPLRTTPRTALEFEVTAAGYATTHVYRSPLPRSSSVVNLRPEALSADDRQRAAVLVFTRPRGYFDAQRDRMSFDGQSPPPGVPPQGAGIASSKIALAQATARTVQAEFNGERIAGRVWPGAPAEVTVLELTY